jgi:hypothetical protein
VKLPSAHDKLMHACKHLAHLDDAVNTFRASDSNIGTFKFDAHSQSAVFEMPFTNPPTEVALIFGDLAHCLRASLDHAAAELTRGKIDPLKVHFPFAKEFQSFNGVLKKYLSSCAAEVVDAVRDEVRPFLINTETGEQGNVRLWTMSHFDNTDKHRQIILSWTKAKWRLGGASVRRAGNSNETGTSTIEANGNISTEVEILIGEEGHYKGSPIIDVAQDLIEVTAETLNTLERVA